MTRIYTSNTILSVKTAKNQKNTVTIPSLADCTTSNIVYLGLVQELLYYWVCNRPPGGRLHVHSQVLIRSNGVCLFMKKIENSALSSVLIGLTFTRHLTSKRNSLNHFQYWSLMKLIKLMKLLNCFVFVLYAFVCLV